MRRIYTLSILLFTGLLFIGCSDSVSDLNTKDVTVSVKSEDLAIKNNFNHSIYYFVVKANTAIYIKWAPISSDENRIKSRSIKRIPLNEINASGTGDEILVYYWSEKEPSNNNIKFQRIETK